jgi:hypothetical protein
MDVTTATHSRRNTMNTNTIDAEETPDRSAPKVKRKHAAAKKTNRKSKADGAKKPVKTKTERANKKSDLMAMLKQAKGATLAETMAATGWQAHTVRGFTSILGTKGGEKIESSKNDAGKRTYRIVK